MLVKQSWMCFFVWTAWFLDSVIVLEKSDVKTGHLTFKGRLGRVDFNENLCCKRGSIVLFEEISSKPSASCSFFFLGPVVKNKCKGIISKAQWSNSCFLIVFRDSKVAPPIFVLVESSQGLHLCAVLNKNYGSTAATPKPCAIPKHLFLGIAIIDIRKTCKVVGHRVEVVIDNWAEKNIWNWDVQTKCSAKGRSIFCFP